MAKWADSLTRVMGPVPSVALVVLWAGSGPSAIQVPVLQVVTGAAPVAQVLPVVPRSTVAVSITVTMPEVSRVLMGRRATTEPPREKIKVSTTETRERGAQPDGGISPSLLEARPSTPKPL